MKRYIEFVYYRALAELQGDVSRMLFGIFWWLLEPVFYMAVFYLIFGIIFAQRDENYVSFLLTGLVMWKWFSSSINNSVNSIQRNMALIYQVYLPKVVFPLVAVLSSTIRFLLVLVLLCIFLLAAGMPFSVSWLLDLPVLLLIQVLLIIGIAMTVSAIRPLLPDIKFVVENGMMLLFFLSGVFFKLEAVPESLQPYFDINPVGVLISGYRRILIDGEPVGLEALWSPMFFALLFLMIGSALLIWLDRVYAKRAL